MLKFQQREKMMKKYFEVLRKCPLFDGIADNDMTEMMGCLEMRKETYKKERIIFAEGDMAKYLGIVLSGMVQIIRIDYDGNRSIAATIEPPQIFGESFACAGVVLPVDVVAGSDTEILLMDAHRIAASCGTACRFHQQLIFNLLRITAAKNLMFHQKLEVTSKRTTREKLMTYLKLQAKAHHSRHFYIPLNRQELADYLEVERSGLSAEISKLRKENVIKCRKNEFTLIKGDGNGE